MTEPWTPGPWEVAEEYEHGEAAPLKVKTALRNGRWLAKVVYKDDARLIAAAPEMAELLDGEAKEYAGCLDEECFHNKAEALLSRIRGEA